MSYYLPVLRAAMVIELDRAWPLIGFWDDVPEFTCDNCARAPECDSVYDGYNTDGDCLESK